MVRICGLLLPKAKRAHPDLNQGPADLQSAALTTELCTLPGHVASADCLGAASCSNGHHSWAPIRLTFPALRTFVPQEALGVEEILWPSIFVA